MQIPFLAVGFLLLLSTVKRGDGPGCCSFELHTGYTGSVETLHALKPSEKPSGKFQLT